MDPPRRAIWTHLGHKYTPPLPAARRGQLVLSPEEAFLPVVRVSEAGPGEIHEDMKALLVSPTIGR